MSKTWLITGANRGIGLEIAQSVLANGDNVVATGRSLAKLEAALGKPSAQLAFAQLDVQFPTQAQGAVDVALQKFKRIDVLVNNAGYGQLGHFETVSDEAVAQQFSTNVFGLMHVTRAVLPVMRAQRSGHLFNLSSIGGTLGFNGAAIYCATKFAVEGVSESLALELAPFGIKVTIVEPGFFRTDFLDISSVKYGDQTIEDYAEGIRQQRAEFDSYSHAQPGDPRKLAEVMVRLSKEDAPPLRLVAGSDALEMSRSLLAARLDELEKWSDTSVSTAHE
ncbi:SDR family NAD(P)-dependent oxidoreductase [Alkalimonas collagenimarina]|uniref:SDR family NAD(P)-dependent oxidoreductase n=1 Tax=Alkalimonas collagenimarina TaxID=400390 RepID=A0ABT9GVS3_9GAMM|nr:SDR family NAD(P)-dependent oxidoreductase [Alkalimonas collagenimarina]MDP4535137.1 SDR family NAD(P)-dependent oxidoreductase [Alkalimonas collagenimarina]